MKSEIVLRPHIMDQTGNNELPLTLRNIKEWVNSLSETQLEQKAAFWGDEICGEIYAIERVDENVINPTGEVMEGESDYPDKNDIDGEPVVMYEGSFILLASKGIRHDDLVVM